MERISGVSPAMKHIFLTGGSGFVGGHLLASLLRHTDARVICLMRGDTISQATQRLATSLDRRQLTVDLSRVDILLGDLSKPRLGLQDSRYAELQQSLDLIIHAGADVSLYSKYDKLKAVNVDGVGRVLEFANGVGRIPVTHLSSYSIFNEASYREEQVVFEVPLLGKEPIFRNGYAESKWRAERVCDESVASGASVKILRLPYILGAVSTGECNPQGYIDLILKAMLRTSSAPELDFGLNALPVDLCADLVLRISLHSPAESGIFHLMPFAPFHWSELCEAAGKSIHNLEHLTPLQWYQHIKKCTLTHRDLLPVVALLALDPPLMQFQSNIHRLRFDIRNLTHCLGNPPTFPDNRSAYLRRMMESVAKI